MWVLGSPYPAEQELKDFKWFKKKRGEVGRGLNHKVFTAEVRTMFRSQAPTQKPVCNPRTGDQKLRLGVGWTGQPVYPEQPAPDPVRHLV